MNVCRHTCLFFGLKPWVQIFSRTNWEACQSSLISLTGCGCVCVCACMWGGGVGAGGGDQRFEIRWVAHIEGSDDRKAKLAGSAGSLGFYEPPNRSHKIASRAGVFWSSSAWIWTAVVTVLIFSPPPSLLCWKRSRQHNIHECLRLNSIFVTASELMSHVRQSLTWLWVLSAQVRCGKQIGNAQK